MKLVTSNMVTPLWQQIVNSANVSKNVSAQAKTMRKIIAQSFIVAEQFKNLHAIAEVIRTCGASEGLMACINEKNQLANCLGITIPIINAVNARKVGIACCEAIEEKVADQCAMIKKFLSDMLTSVSNFANTLNSNAACQKETLQSVNDNILANVEVIDTEAFDAAKIVGYTAPVFKERVEALNSLVENILECNSLDCIPQFAETLKKLGYIVEETVQIREETVAEAKADEPEVEPAADAETEQVEQAEQEAEVEALYNAALSYLKDEADEEDKDEAKAEEDEPEDKGETSDEEEQPSGEEPAETTEEVPAEEAPAADEQPAEAETEEPEQGEDLPADNIEATDGIQNEEVKDMCWTPQGISEACASVIALLDNTSKMGELAEKTKGLINDAMVKCDGENCNCEDLDKDRRYISFLSSVLNIFATSVNELVDQVVAMSALLKKNEVSADQTSKEDLMSNNMREEESTFEDFMKWVNEESDKAGKKVDYPDEEDEHLGTWANIKKCPACGKPIGTDGYCHECGRKSDKDDLNEEVTETTTVEDPVVAPAAQPEVAPEQPVVEETVTETEVKPEDAPVTPAETPVTIPGMVEDPIIAPTAQPVDPTVTVPAEQPAPVAEPTEPVAAPVEPAEQPEAQVTEDPIMDILRFFDETVNPTNLPGDATPDNTVPAGVKETTTPDSNVIEPKTKVYPDEAYVTKNPEDKPAEDNKQLEHPEKSDRSTGFWI